MNDTGLEGLGAHVHPAARCMELWGRAQEREEAMSLPGIQAWLHTAPFADQDDGGDVLFISTCGYDHIYRFALADVAGHGNAVAAFAADLRGLMRAHVEEIDQTEFARSLNRGWFRGEHPGRFATALFVTCLLPERELVVCNAGHPKPLWYQADRQRWTLLETQFRSTAVENLPLGIIEPTPYSQFAIPIGEQDLLVLYTDAYIESRVHGRPLGERGLLKIAESLRIDLPRAFGRALCDAVAAVIGSFDDDRTLLVLAPSGAS